MKMDCWLRRSQSFKTIVNSSLLLAIKTPLCKEQSTWESTSKVRWKSQWETWLTLRRRMLVIQLGYRRQEKQRMSTLAKSLIFRTFQAARLWSLTTARRYSKRCKNLGRTPEETTLTTLLLHSRSWFKTCLSGTLLIKRRSSNSILKTHAMKLTSSYSNVTDLSMIKW